MATVTVITHAVENEAKKWRQLADKMEPIHGAVGGLGLGLTAFFIGDANAGAHSAAYNGYQTFMQNILSGAVTEFGQLAAALDKIAAAYDRADEIVSLDLNKIYSA
jgi:hypothetical protein